MRDEVNQEAWLRRLADQGNTTAMYNLAKLLAKRQNSAEAEMYFEKLAWGLNVSAMYQVAMLNIDKDLHKAKKWLEKASDYGHPDAMLTLALLIWNEKQVEAGVLLRRSEKLGHEEARETLIQLVQLGIRSSEAKAAFYRQLVEMDDEISDMDLEHEYSYPGEIHFDDLPSCRNCGFPISIENNVLCPRCQTFQ